MNRVKAGDAWARVSTKRYSSRLDGNEARIESLASALSLRRSLFHRFLRPRRFSVYASENRSLQLFAILPGTHLFRLITRE